MELLSKKISGIFRHVHVFLTLYEVRASPKEGVQEPSSGCIPLKSRSDEVTHLTAFIEGL